MPQSRYSDHFRLSLVLRCEPTTTCELNPLYLMTNVDHVSHRQFDLSWHRGSQISAKPPAGSGRRCSTAAASRRRSKHWQGHRDAGPRCLLVHPPFPGMLGFVARRVPSPAGNRPPGSVARRVPSPTRFCRHGRPAGFASHRRVGRMSSHSSTLTPMAEGAGAPNGRATAGLASGLTECKPTRLARRLPIRIALADPNRAPHIGTPPRRPS